MYIRFKSGLYSKDCFEGSRSLIRTFKEYKGTNICYELSFDTFNYRTINYLSDIFRRKDTTEMKLERVKNKQSHLFFIYSIRIVELKITSSISSFTGASKVELCFCLANDKDLKKFKNVLMGEIKEAYEILRF